MITKLRLVPGSGDECFSVPQPKDQKTKMKLKTLLTALIGSVVLSGIVSAGTSWAPSAKGKCPIEECPDIGGHVGVGYMSDYIFRGVRFTRDALYGHASYTFDRLPAPVTLGVRHVTSLGGFDALGGGDHNNIYASVALPSVFGFDLSLGYDHYFYPNVRGPSPGIFGDSHGALGLTVARDLFAGVSFAYTAAYDFVWPGNLGFRDNGAWIHTLALGKTVDLTDRLSLALSGGVLYTDNVWPGGSGSNRASGWNNYYLEAGLPIDLNCRATLTPYLGYNGTPDTWMADGINGVFGANANDVLYWGIRLGVDF